MINGGNMNDIINKMFGSKKKEENSCNNELNIKDIRNNFLYTNDNKVVSYIKIYSINVNLYSRKEKENLINRLSAELSSETKPFKFFTIARPIEITEQIDYLLKLQELTNNKVQKQLIKQQISELMQLAMMGDRVERQTYMIVWQENGEYAEKELLKRSMDIQNKFNSCSINTKLLNEEEIIQLANSFTNAIKENSNYIDNIPVISETYYTRE